MKTAIYILNGVTQLVLTAENEHEKSVLALEGAINNKRAQAYRGSFYHCQGGWYRQGSDDDSLIIVMGEEE